MLIAERVYFSILVNHWTHPPGQRITSVDDVNTQNYEIALFTLVGVAVLAFVALIAVLCLLRRRSGETMGKITIPKKETPKVSPFVLSTEKIQTSCCLVLSISLNIFHFELFYF